MKAEKPTHPTPKRPAHRPVSIDARRVNVSLDETTIERAREIGDGNLSEGIRRAVSTTGATNMKIAAELRAEIKGLKAALDKFPHYMTPDEEDGEPDYYADGFNDCLATVLAMRERREP